jgi:hypothetical protein
MADKRSLKGEIAKDKAVARAKQAEQSLGDNLTILEGALQQKKLQAERLRGQVRALQDSLRRIEAVASKDQPGREAELLIQVGDIARQALGKK